MVTIWRTKEKPDMGSRRKFQREMRGREIEQ